MVNQKGTGSETENEKLFWFPLCNAPCSYAENDQCSMCREEPSIIENSTYDCCGMCDYWASPLSLPDQKNNKINDTSAIQKPSGTNSARKNRRLNMQPNSTSGVLITFCGLDGCGKTTLMRALRDYLQSAFSVVLTKQPTPQVRNSEIFRNFMDQKDHYRFEYRSLSLLAASDRVQHNTSFILPQLESGKIILSDRYFYSCLANLCARGYQQDRWIYEIAESIVKPDIAFFCDIPVETAVRRVRERKDEKDRYIDLELQYNLREEYLSICTSNNGILVDTSKPLEETVQFVKNEVREVLLKKELLFKSKDSGFVVD